MNLQNEKPFTPLEIVIFLPNWKSAEIRNEFGRKFRDTVAEYRNYFHWSSILCRCLSSKRTVGYAIIYVSATCFKFWLVLLLRATSWSYLDGTVPYLNVVSFCWKICEKSDVFFRLIPSFMSFILNNLENSRADFRQFINRFVFRSETKTDNGCRR